MAGGIESVAPLSIIDCTVRDNLAIAGNGGTGPFVGVAQGGALNLVFGSASIVGSTFDHNQAIGGSGGNSGTGNDDPFIDYAFGGAIAASYFSTISVASSTRIDVMNSDHVANGMRKNVMPGARILMIVTT